MYPIVHSIFSDKKTEEIFTLFSAWHYFFIILTVVSAALLLFLLRKKSADVKKKTVRLLSSVSFALYIADFFIMPLSQNEINIEELPFHVCTATCTMLFLSHRVHYLEKYRTSIALLGFVSNLVYTIYPAGVMWFALHPLSYRVVQTLLFHSLMCVCCLLTFVYGRISFNRKEFLRDGGVLACMILWALLGNYCYNGTSEGYSHFFNWFFVVRDPFNLFPESAAPFIMPFLNFFIFFAVGMLVNLIVSTLKKASKKERSPI